MEELNIKQNIPKTNPFKVPAGYFEQLKEDILARVPKGEEPKVVDVAWWQRLYRPLIGVAASVCVAILSVSVYMHSESRDKFLTDQQKGDNPMELLYASDDATDYIMLDNDDMYRYMAGIY